MRATRRGARGAGWCWARAASSALPGRSARSTRWPRSRASTPHEADIIVGTSAGSVLAALLGCGLHRGRPAATTSAACRCRARSRWTGATTSRPAARTPARPRLAVGSPALLRRSLARPRQVPPLAVLAALTPPGHGHPRRGRRHGRARSPATAGGRRGTASGSWRWTTTPAAGRLRPRGRAAGHAGRGGDGVLRDPGLVRAGPDRRPPVRRRRHPVGDQRSTCSAREGLDEVYVLAPMASFVSDQPRQVAARLERRLRRQVTRRLLQRGAERQPRRHGRHRARPRAGGPGDDRRQPDGPAHGAWPCSRPRCAPAGWRCRPAARRARRARRAVAAARLRGESPVATMRVYLPCTLSGCGRRSRPARSTRPGLRGDPGAARVVRRGRPGGAGVRRLDRGGPGVAAAARRRRRRLAPGRAGGRAARRRRAAGPRGPPRYGEFHPRDTNAAAPGVSPDEAWPNRTVGVRWHHRSNAGLRQSRHLLPVEVLRTRKCTRQWFLENARQQHRHRRDTPSSLPY